MNKVQCFIIDLTKFNSHLGTCFPKPAFKKQKACRPDKP
jgi:hypothetical protein